MTGLHQNLIPDSCSRNTFSQNHTNHQVLSDFQTAAGTVAIRHLYSANRIQPGTFTTGNTK